MEITKCDLCGSDSYKNVACQSDVIHKSTSDFFNVVECNNCSLTFTNPRPTADEIGNFYTESYRFHHNSGLKTYIKRSIFGSILRFIANSPLAYLSILFPPLSKLLSTLVRPSIDDPVIKLIKAGHARSFLDIGCGSGINAAFWGSKSSLVKCKNTIDVYGCEIDQHSRNYVNNNGIKCWSDISEINSGKKFDIIRMNWSLEHAHYPSEYFKFFKNNLSENGRVIIGVPNNKGLLYQIEPNALELPIHLHHFSLDTLSKYCKKNDLEIVEEKTFSYPSMFSYAVDIGLLPKRFKSGRGIFSAKRMQNSLNIFDEFGLGNDIVVTIKKCD